MCLTGELKPSPVATALLPPSLPHRTREKRSEGRSLYLYGECRASWLCSRPSAGGGSSCPPQLSIATVREAAPSSPQPLPPSTPAPLAAQRPAARLSPGYSPAPGPFPARPHPLAFTQSRAGGSLRPGGIPVRVRKKLPVPAAAEASSEKQRRLQARV